jgi:protein-disulfide isomerase
MASRKERREAMRAERSAREQAVLLASRRRRRLYQLGGVLLAAVVIVSVAIAASQGGSSTKKTGGRAGARAVQAELAGIPQSGTTLGLPTAPVTITEYADLQCPVCRDFALNTLPLVTANDVRSGRVRLIFRNLQTATPDPQTFQTEAVAALAAGRQNKLWNYVELFYRDQGAEGSGYVNEKFLTSIAKSIPGLDLARWSRDRNDPELVGEVSADGAAAENRGFRATPSLFIQGSLVLPRSFEGAASYSEVESAIRAVEH